MRLHSPVGQHFAAQAAATAVGAQTIPRLAELLAADPDQFVAKHTDIAAVNLACAEGLPGSEEIDGAKYLALLDTMAAAVRVRVERSWRLFKLKPQEFHNSENIFRVLMMQHVLRVQFGIQYNPAHAHLRPGRGDVGIWTRDSRDIFIHGILGGGMGTCSSLPTFAIAVGRRAGYPLKLVRVPNHTFFRWDDGNEQFNIEHTPAGSAVQPDEYYHTWPEHWDAGMFAMNARTKVWLHSMTPRQEVSKFLCNRAIHLRDEKRYADALEAIRAAAQFDPVNPACADIEFAIECEQRGGMMPGGTGPVPTPLCEFGVEPSILVFGSGSSPARQGYPTRTFKIPVPGASDAGMGSAMIHKLLDSSATEPWTRQLIQSLLPKREH